MVLGHQQTQFLLILIILESCVLIEWDYSKWLTRSFNTLCIDILFTPRWIKHNLVKTSYWICYNFCLFVFRFSKKKKASAEVWCGESADKLPTIKVAPLVPDIFAAYSGPDKGLACVYDLDNANTVEASEWESLLIHSLYVLNFAEGT